MCVQEQLAGVKRLALFRMTATGPIGVKNLPVGHLADCVSG